MIFTWELPVAVIGGATAGGGLLLIVRELLPATPALGPTLARLQPPLDEPLSVRAENALGPWGWLARYVTIPARDLAILGRPHAEYLTSLATSGLIGLFAPGLIYALLTLFGLHVPVVAPVGGGLLFALIFAFLAHRDVMKKARLARREFGRAFCTYLDLVVLELTAAGPVQAMERGAKICHGWVFERIGGALTQAQLQMVFPWSQLKALGEEIGVLELQDFSAIMQSAGDSGAHVQQTLREQADAMRDHQRTDALARAENISAKLEMPAALLVIVLAIFIIYPLIARLG
jgi:tight adherence protein C